MMCWNIWLLYSKKAPLQTSRQIMFDTSALMYRSTFKHCWRPKSHIKIPQWELQRSRPHRRTDGWTDILQICERSDQQISQNIPIIHIWVTRATNQPSASHEGRNIKQNTLQNEINWEKSPFHPHLCTFPSLGSEFSGFGTDLWLLTSSVHCDKAGKKKTCIRKLIKSSLVSFWRET